MQMTRELLHSICKLTKQFVALPDQLASVVGRFVLDAWVIEAFPVAPALIVNGPDAVRGEQLMSLLHCLCRHGVRMTGVTSAGFCSLPSGFGFMILLSQSMINGSLQRLGDASCRDQRIPRRVVLPDLYGVQVIHSESTVEDGARMTFVRGADALGRHAGANSHPGKAAPNPGGFPADAAGVPLREFYESLRLAIRCFEPLEFPASACACATLPRRPQMPTCGRRFSIFYTMRLGGSIEEVDRPAHGCDGGNSLSLR